jgi:hypothetical protein
MRVGLRAFTDLFVRANGALGSPWSLIRGSWTINNNTAYAATAASSYPIATVLGGSTNQTLTANVGAGAGLSFWVTDANNWWGVYRQESNFSYDCSFFTTYCFSGQYCYLFDPNCNEYCEDVCVPFFTCQNDYVPATCTGTNRYLTVIKSVAGTVSTVVQATAAAAIASIRMSISGTSGVATGYSDTNQATSVATTTQALSGPALSAGLILAPSDNTSATVTKFVLSA